VVVAVERARVPRPIDPADARGARVARAALPPPRSPVRRLPPGPPAPARRESPRAGGGGKEFFLSSHPSIGRRVARARMLLGSPG